MNVYFLTLGCKVNQHESQQAADLLAVSGHQVVETVTDADLVIVNTCTVTQVADKKSRQMIRQVSRENPTARIIITGCMPENPSSPIVLPEGCQIVLKSDLRSYLSQLPKVKTERANTAKQGRIRRTLLIQTGCDYYCSYCIIPTVRHGRVSFPREQVVTEFEQLTKAGVKEVVLTGINLATWNDQGHDLTTLLKELLSKGRDFRIRLGSLEPNLVTKELLELMQTHPQLAGHLHIPLQGGADTLLKRMNRRYTLADYVALCARIQSLSRPINITTDLIVGFPGETEDEFQSAIGLIEKGLLLDVHAFAYSVRQGTPAANREQLNGPLVRDRMKLVLSSIEAAKKRKLAAKSGQIATVLVETVVGGVASGYSDGYVKVIFDAKETCLNRFVDVVLGEAVLIGREWGLRATQKTEARETPN